MGLDEKSIGNNGSKSAQCGRVTELPKFFAKIEIEFDPAEMFLPVKSREIVFDRHF